MPERNPEGSFEDYPLTRSEYIAAMVHFYRGERSRADAGAAASIPRPSGRS